MNRRALPALLIISACTFFGAAAQYADASSRSQVKRAVKAEVYDRYGLRMTSVSCTQLTSRRFKCSYVGFERGLSGGPCRGRARATVYSRMIDVTSVSRPRCAW